MGLQIPAEQGNFRMKEFRSQNVHVKKCQLARESAKLDPKLEQEMAEEGMEFELVEWPKHHVANHRYNFNQ
ncbi:hypothetical protein IIA28_19970 [candidate division KSB1 bacterium]|nr:hypothetical protein [candidate division KSB1 bacterium]